MPRAEHARRTGIQPIDAPVVTGTDLLLRPYAATGQRVTIHRYAAAGINAATFPDVEIVRAGRQDAMLDEPRRYGRGHGYIDTTTLYEVTPDT